MPLARWTLLIALLPRFVSFDAQAAEGDFARSLDEGFARYWAANSEWERVRAADALRALDAPYDSVRARLARGRSYRADAPRGKRILRRVDEHGLEHGYIVLVPERYDPRRRYPVRVILHGSIQHGAWRTPGAWWRRTNPFVSEDWFTVFPAAWEDSPWWRHSQVENLAAILRELRREYNLDENRAHLMGLSDGGTGTFFHALKATTPWASFCPLIGHPNVLNHAASRADGQFYAINLRNKPLFVANALEDPLYPAAEVSLYLDLFRRAGARIVYRAQAGGHNVRWWPQESRDIRSFQEQNPRRALPDTLVWESDRVDRYQRAHWLVLDELGTVPGESELGDPNLLSLPAGFSEEERLAFPRERPSGRVELVRVGNTVHARTRGVVRFRLLLSADQFDLELPVRVVVNGRTVRTARARRDPEVLWKWALRDEDRTMLFDDEWEILVPYR